ncbi:hypothetical protein B5M42_009465 [Paenibacillus athensensis]|nr:hypothetical protein [Paenibacillus athensensis]MCD1259064.1 hypothetical protein [Paenibacillus athensensis]
MKTLILRLITFIVAAVALVVPVAGPLSWFSYSPDIPDELKKQWQA